MSASDLPRAAATTPAGRPRRASRDPWDRLAVAAKLVGGHLADEGAPGSWRIVLGSQGGELSVCRDERLGKFHLQASICDRGRALATAPDLAAAPPRLSLARPALADGQLLSMAEVPACIDEAAMADVLALVAEDTSAIRRIARSPTRHANTASEDDRPSDDAAVRVAAKAVDDWVASAASPDWIAVPRTDGWRLVRARGAPAFLPAACELVTGRAVFTAAADIRVWDSLGAECARALSLFLLRRNAREPIRCSLCSQVGKTDGSSVVRLDAPMLIAAATRDAIDDAMDAVCAAYEGLRHEVAALSDKRVARDYLWMCDRGTTIS